MGNKRKTKKPNTLVISRNQAAIFDLEKEKKVQDLNASRYVEEHFPTLLGWEVGMGWRGACKSKRMKLTVISTSATTSSSDAAWCCICSSIEQQKGKKNRWLWRLKGTTRATRRVAGLQGCLFPTRLNRSLPTLHTTTHQYEVWCYSLQPTLSGTWTLYLSPLNFIVCPLRALNHYVSSLVYFKRNLLIVEPMHIDF